MPLTDIDTECTEGVSDISFNHESGVLVVAMCKEGCKPGLGGMKISQDVSVCLFQNHDNPLFLSCAIANEYSMDIHIITGANKQERTN